MTEQKEAMVSMYDPTVDAYRQVPVSLAEKFIEQIEDLKSKIAEAQVEQAKEEAYANSLKSKKDGK